MHERLRQHGGSGRPVADPVMDAPGQVADEHATHVFERIRELDRSAGDDRGAVEDLGRLAADDWADGHRPRQRTQCRTQQPGHAVDAAQQRRARRWAFDNAPAHGTVGWARATRSAHKRSGLVENNTSTVAWPSSQAAHWTSASS